MSDEREAAFERHLERSENYFAAVEAAGDLPWYEDPEKLGRLEPKIPGISGMTTKERRRALFMRHRKPDAPAS
jgi:hypothetical protein